VVRPTDAYTTLGVDRDADDAAIATAYRNLARRYHPDVAGDGATSAMMRINAAFDLVRTPERRDDYDRDLDEDEAGRPIQRRRRARTTEGRRTRADAGAPEPQPAGAFAAPASSRPSADPAAWRSGWVPERDGTGGAGPPPGRPSGSVLSFGRHIGWSIGEIARSDPGYLVWLEERHEGRAYRTEIDSTLRATGYRHDKEASTVGSKKRR
jgi:curved DNA-binding protein CbpA